MNNTAGSYALLKAQVSQDSTVAAKLRQAGAVILGKTDIAQWAACRGTNSSAGWSAHGGQTVGVYYPSQSPSGSSSGSGVSTSIGLVWASLGTETSGSITLPSEVNNILDLKGKLLGIPRHILEDIRIPHSANYSIETFDSAVDILKSAGAEIVDDIILPDFLVNLETYLSELTWNPQNISTLAQLRQWTQQDPREEYPEHNTDAWDMLLARGLRNTGPEFWAIYTRSQHLAGELGYSGALKNHSLDAIVLPTKFALICPPFLEHQSSRCRLVDIRMTRPS
ncbi:putative amidase [Colletotrichum orbiculare MAFF 240422]|uniref:Amidase n=1 Tax=Colletotrichum orbiculare (strain 104-T / ATCC 96160 / CBS 514.97 / LARS 414 / MAFF 240422) TaxID=1213857 RepID=A0A484FJN8_COLOR|nr:putative amidase [Colletotrichum orbiculare MAFF 240422]